MHFRQSYKKKTSPRCNNVWYVSVTVRNCGTPPDIGHATRTGEDFTFNNTVSYRCSPHRHFAPDVYSTEIRCRENGTWSDVLSAVCECK